MKFYPWIRDGLIAVLVMWPTYEVGHSRAEHDVAARFYHHCREELGLFEPMTALQKGQSACALRIQTELGIENRWKEEMP